MFARQSLAKPFLQRDFCMWYGHLGHASTHPWDFFIWTSPGKTQRKNKHSASVAKLAFIQAVLKANVTEEQPIGAGKGRAEGPAPMGIPQFFCPPVGRWSCILSDGSPYIRGSLG